MDDETVVVDTELPDIGDAELAAIRDEGGLREAPLQERERGRSRCNICQRRCLIPEGRAGYCMTKVNVGGTIYSTIYGVISSASADPVEKKPVYHYKPGSMVYSVGSLGCNFRCLFCQNWQIAFADAVQPTGMCQYKFMPPDLVRAAQDSRCEGVAFTYNEPGIWLDYTLDCAKLAKEASLYTVYVTNGYATPEHIDAIGPYLDVYRVDLKSMSDDFYRQLIKVPSAKGIRNVAIHAKERWNMHVECVTNVIPTWNDSDENLSQTANWIVENLGPLTPWHVTRFFPYAMMKDVPPTPPEMLFHAADIGRRAGLKFVYIGNLATTEGQNTHCYNDGSLVIERSGYNAIVRGLTPEGKCETDGAYLNIRL